MGSQHTAFASKSFIYLEDLRLGFQAAPSPGVQESTDRLEAALADDSLRANALELLQNLSDIDKNRFSETMNLMRGNLSEELWEAIQAGRESTLALLRGERGDTTERQVTMWRKELDEALGRTPTQIDKALKWLETNEET